MIIFFGGYLAERKTRGLYFFSLPNILFPSFSLGVFEGNSVSSHSHFSLLLTFLSFPAHGWRSLAHHGAVYGWISMSKYLGLYASLRILGWVGCLNTEL